jgi:osmotically-inducible protein OsmY
VRNGTVTLTGYVKTPDDKEKVEREIRDIDGVASLDSKISVSEPNSKEEPKYPQDTYGTAADEQLNKRIRDKISSEISGNSYKDIALDTANGDIVLEGSVKDLKDQQKIMVEIQKIPGVKSVKSELKVQNLGNE